MVKIGKVSSRAEYEALEEAGVESPGFVEEFCTKPYVDDDGVQVASGIGKDGKEYPDPVPFSVPIGYEAPPDLMSMIRSMVHNEAAKRILDDAGMETIDDADDFYIEDDPVDPLTPYEKVFEPPPAPPPTAAAPSPSPVATEAKGPGSGEGAVASPPPGNAQSPT